MARITNTVKRTESFHVNRRGEVTKTIYTNTDTTTRSKNWHSLSMRTVISLLIIVFLFFSINNFQSYVIRYGSIETRDYVVTNYVNEDYTVDSQGFESYSNMEVPVMSLTQGLLPKIQAISDTVSTNAIRVDFEEWSKLNTPQLYEMKFGNVFERAVWNFTSIFTELYFNIFVKGLYIPDFLRIIGILFGIS